MTAYYNENNHEAAAWLRELIKAGLIAPGEVDERSIEDVRPADLDGFTQCHFFAGIGVWSWALRCAGWTDDREVWTGSCPCQPFSQAGKRLAFDDPRHLWPTWFRLIRQHRPHTVFGEQVANGLGLSWLDHVLLGLEGEGYACGAADTCAAGFGAPHIRQRLYWVADATSEGSPHRGAGTTQSKPSASVRDTASRLAEPHGAGLQQGRPSATTTRHGYSADANGSLDRPRPTDGFWRDADWLFCRDGKWRPVEPGAFPLAHGSPARVGRLRGYGNGLVAPQAEAFVRAYMETIGLPTRRDPLPLLAMGGAVMPMLPTSTCVRTRRNDQEAKAIADRH